MGYLEKIGLTKGFLLGMFVRVPVEEKRPDKHYRDYRIGKIYKLNQSSNTTIINLLSYSPGEKPKQELIECSLREIVRCRVLPNTRATIVETGEVGTVLVDRENFWVDGEYKHYFVDVAGEIK